MMNIETSISLGYKDVFDDFDTIDIETLITDIPSKNSLQILGYFIAQIHAKERSLQLQIELLRMWCNRLPSDVIQPINDFIERTLQRPNSSFNFINNIAALILTEHVLENYNELEALKDLSPEQELNLFKAYLLCNQEWTDKPVGLIPPKIKKVEEFIKFFIPAQLPYLEIIEFKDFRLQFIKAIYFFRFCENDPTFKGYLQKFLDEYGLNSWQAYLTNILSLYVRRFEELRTPSILTVDDEHEEIKRFISQFSLDVSTFTKTNDFKTLRSFPVFKFNENDFLFLNLNFFVDKLFQGIQFDFFRILKKHKMTFNDKEIKVFDQFRSIYGEILSEQGIFYQTIESCFDNCGYKMINGQDAKAKLKDGEPDYYIRDKGKVYLFEYKDVLLNADIKHSYDFEQISSEIDKKLISNQKGHSKGITQLYESIRKIRNNEYSDVDEYDNLKDSIIYPILVFTDFSFNLPGINYYLNQRFLKLINDSDIHSKHKVKDLTIIDIDTFLKFQDLFRDGRLKINSCLNDYRSITRNTKNIMSSIESFNIFIHNKTQKIKYESPGILMKEIHGMIKT